MVNTAMSFSDCKSTNDDSGAGAQFSSAFSKIHNMCKDAVQPNPKGFASLSSFKHAH